MSALEFWTLVRFTLYPIILLFGLTWALWHWRLYRRGRCAADAWAFWLGLAIAINGGSGLASLMIASTIGFGPVSSMVFTVGPLVLVLVLVTATAARFLEAWRR